jgi:hypothetical protein
MYTAVSLRVTAIRHKHMGEFHKCFKVPYLALNNPHTAAYINIRKERLMYGK